MITKEEQEGTFVAIEKFRILTAVVVAQIYPSDEMTQNYTHTLYQCHLPDFDTVCKIVNTGPYIRSNHWRKLGKRNLGPLCTILGVSCESMISKQKDFTKQVSCLQVQEFFTLLKVYLIKLSLSLCIQGPIQSNLLLFTVGSLFKQQ